MPVWWVLWGIGVVNIAVVFASVVVYGRSRRISRIGKQLLARDEVLDLIRDGLVRSFTRRHGVLEVSLHPRATKHRDLWERRAHPQDYLAFVTAADVLLADGRVIYYADETGQGPSSINYRWITFAEAAALLGADKVSEFVRGADPGDGRTAFHGTPTGIGLADYGWGRRIEVAPAQAAALVPLARAAQATHRRLQFRVDGSWEVTAGG
ncbi:hypothetical protein SAMN04489727_5170 [Amycolatopsis tolypomycina]|uniref:Uncharacterized protein n=1 Tax=Amycolatopsis tolypomycina TaxID=208445 RepID=A0A1H4VIT8_9PSEU|nr:hypothetical protein [Amycolatopsis tolypomycina]SEC80927.1 hypothetical protein SAMN04489727_5170 [Amycolatopsis tolypomycina]